MIANWPPGLGMMGVPGGPPPPGGPWEMSTKNDYSKNISGEQTERVGQNQVRETHHIVSWWWRGVCYLWEEETVSHKAVRCDIKKMFGGCTHWVCVRVRPRPSTSRTPENTRGNVSVCTSATVAVQVYTVAQTHMFMPGIPGPPREFGGGLIPPP